VSYAVLPKYPKGDEKKDGRTSRSSPYFNTKTIVDLFEGSIMEQRRNQVNLNISLGIQTMLTRMYVVYEMYNIKELSFVGVFA
jgi:hypothetical protein